MIIFHFEEKHLSSKKLWEFLEEFERQCGIGTTVIDEDSSPGNMYVGMVGNRYIVGFEKILKNRQVRYETVKIKDLPRAMQNAFGSF